VKAFVLAVGDDKLLFESENNDPDEKRRIIGAFIPAAEGNYYRELLIGFREKDGGYSMSFQSWWTWVKESIARNETLIDDEFSFDPEDVRIITVEINMGAVAICEPTCLGPHKKHSPGVPDICECAACNNGVCRGARMIAP